ncbi:hypothetical protein D3C71_1273880 [compost metagenome]
MGQNFAFFIELWFSSVGFINAFLLNCTDLTQLSKEYIFILLILFTTNSNFGLENGHSLFLTPSLNYCFARLFQSYLF